VIEKNKDRTLVVGLGASGAAAAAFLARRGVQVVATDSSDNETLRARCEPLRDLGVEIQLGTENLPTDVSEVVTSPGVPPNRFSAFREAHIPVVGELELGCREVTAPIIAVTGTNGKSTVVTNIEKGLVACGLKARALGNLGLPVTRWIEENEEVDYLVLEVSSYQLETIASFKPHIGLILNVAPDHLSRHQTMEEYVAAKGRISDNQTIEDVLILHRDLAKWPSLQNTRGRLYWYGRDLDPSLEGLSLGGSSLTWRGGGGEWSREVSLHGLPDHEIDNLMGAAVVLLEVGVAPEKTVNLFDAPVRLPHRLEPVGQVRGIRFINDSKATNAHAAIAALRAVEGELLWLVGGEGKGEDLSDLVSEAIERRPVCIVCFGRDRAIFQKALHDLPVVECCETLSGAFSLACERAEAGHTILLSPACASFDEFGSFEERGDAFKSWVAAALEEGT